MTRRHRSHVRPARWLVLVPVLALIASSVIAVASAPVSAGTGPTPITDCTDDTQLQADAAAGGSYVFACDGYIFLAQTLTVTSDLSIDAGGHSVAIDGGIIGTSGSRAFDIEAGTVTLTGLRIYGHSTASGADGANGQNGGSGSDGSAGVSLQGGAMFIAPGANVILSGSDVGGRLNSTGGKGGEGAGATSGNGNGGQGGSGGNGGDVQGGAVYVSSGAKLTANNGTSFGYSTVFTYGGMGGDGGVSGSNGQGGSGGNGGSGGDAEGGAIYNAGTLMLADATFSSDSASSGDVNQDGGWADTNANGEVDTGGNGGSGSNGGDAEGGAIYNASTGTLSLQGVSFQSDSASSQGGSGGDSWCNTLNDPGCAGQPGAGGNGGDAEGGAVYTNTTPTACQFTFSGDSVSSQGGVGGVEGENYSHPSGTPGTPGTTAGTDVYDPTDPGVASSGCVPAVSVSDAFVQEPTKGSVNATFHVTMSQASQSSVSVGYTTVDGTAGNGYGAATVAHGDYKKTAGTLIFSPGQTAKTVTVPVYASGLAKDSRFSLVLSNATGAVIDKGIGIATITVCGNPGAQSASCPLVTVTDPTVVEPTKGTTKAQFRVDLSEAPLQAITVAYTTKDGSATAPRNYVVTKGTLSFAKGQYEQTVDVPVRAVKKPHEPLKFSLVATSATGGARIVAPWNSARAMIFSPYVTFQATRGTFVPGKKYPKLVRAGTTFAIHLSIHNYRPQRVQVNWFYPKLRGNATDGRLLPASQPVPQGPATGLDEVVPNPYLVLQPPDPKNPPGTLAPGEKRAFNLVVRTTASDAWSSLSPKDGFPDGGTRATVKLPQPVVSKLDATNHATALPKKAITLESGWGTYHVGIDDSAPAPPPYSTVAAVGAFGKGVVLGLWDLTAGSVQAAWHLASETIPSAGSAVLNNMKQYMDYEVALWQATKDDPAAEAQFLSTLTNQVLQALKETPWKLEVARENWRDQVDAAAAAWEDNLAMEWYAGDWRAAEVQVVRPATMLFAPTVAEVATALAPGVLARLPAVSDAFEAARAQLVATVSERLAPVVDGFTSALSGIRALDQVPAGYEFSASQLEKLAGLSREQVEWLIDFCKRNKLIITLRSRAAQSLKWIEENLAFLKPEWIKTKTVNWYDRYLGYSTGDIGKIVVKLKLPSRDEFYATLARYGVREGTTEYNNAILNYANRLHELAQYSQVQADGTLGAEGYKLLQYEKDGFVRAKWNWRDNGLSPFIQSNQYHTYRFRLCPAGNCLVTAKDIRLAIERGEALTPEIYANGRWHFITGDIDFTSITYKSGLALNDADYIHYFKQIRAGPLGAEHPAAATWYGPNGEFMFPLKEKYLSNGGKPQIQFGPDGAVRAVVYDKHLNDLLKAFDFFKDRNNYYIFWRGGYEDH